MTQNFINPVKYQRESLIDKLFSTDNPHTQKIALNNEVNLQKHSGVDNVAIEIEIQGLSLITSLSSNVCQGGLDSAIVAWDASNVLNRKKI